MSDPKRLEAGDPAPAFELLDQHEQTITLDSLSGAPVLLYFFPKASTPGCTNQSRLLRDIAEEVSPARIIGISPDSPKRQANFDTKNELGFPLLSDPDHAVASAYGVWGPKKLYGKVYEGIIRSAFLIDADGQLAAPFYKISPKDTPVKLMAALEALEA